jgi:hypothetical protein
MRIGGSTTVILACMLSGVMSGCSRETSANSSASVDTPESASPVAAPAVETGNAPSSLTDAGEFAENIYDRAAANDWTGAAFGVGILRGAVRKVRADVQHRSDVKAALDGHVLALDRAVREQNRWLAMREANHVTLAVADLTAGYKLRVPVELMKLDYYGRELEIWAEVEDMERLQTTASEMVKEWDRLRPAIDARNPPAEGQKVGDLLAQVEGAQTSDDYARLSKSVLDEVDHLETLFN